MQNIAETLADVARLHGDKTGLIEAKSGLSVSFAELNRRSDRYAEYLSEHGVAPLDRTMLMVRPSAEFICLTFGLFKLGATIILIDPGMGYANLLRCIERVEPKVLIGIPKAHYFSRLFPKPFTAVRHRFSCGNSFGLGGPNILKAGQQNGNVYPVYQPQKDDLAAIIFTTGSTGPPKGVAYQHKIFAAQLRLIRDYYKISSEDVDQPAFPLFALFSTALGACAVIPDMDPTKPAKVDPVRFVSSLDRHQVTYSFGSPALWNVVSNYCIEQNKVLGSIKKILIAGAPVSGELLKKVRMIVPEKAEIYTPYGATESLPIVSIESREVIDSTWVQSRNGHGICVGRHLPGIDIKIIARKNGVIPEISQCNELPLGEIGEILVRGDVVTTSYVNNPQETRMAKIADGETFWHRMGDVGYLDDVGRLWFCGRKAHSVLTKSGYLNTICCEAISNEHPAVFRSALVGVGNPAGEDTQLPVMIIEPRKDFNGNPAQLVEQVATLLAKHPQTKDIKNVLIHKDFPVDIRHNAKIFREKLAVWAHTEMKNK